MTSSAGRVVSWDRQKRPLWVMLAVPDMKREGGQVLVFLFSFSVTKNVNPVVTFCALLHYRAVIFR